MSVATTRTKPRATIVAAIALAGCLAAAGTALADATGKARPDAAGGRATAVSWDVDGLAPPVSGRIPRTLTVVAPGFRLDRGAVGERCRELEAKLDECPRGSRIGTGTLGIVVHRPAGRNEIDFDIVLYHARGTRVYAVTDFVGIRVVPGRLTDSGGVRLTFDPLPTPPEIPGVPVTYEFKGVAVKLDARRRARRGRGRRASVRSLVRTPRRCTEDGWEATATLGFPDGTHERLPTPMECTARRR